MKYIFLFCLLPTIAICQDASEIVEWNYETIDLGLVEKGESVSNIFEFTNISGVDVEIDIVNTCVCTEAKWPQYAIEPGETARIEFTFDSNKKDDENPVELDVYFVNTNPKNGNPYSTYLNYTFRWKD